MLIESYDGVINHRTCYRKDVAWPNYWVRTSPVCDYKNYQNTTECTLVANLPDIRTESTQNVDLLLFDRKWKKEGVTTWNERIRRFFQTTGYPPRYYIIKWLTDYIADYGIDGYRADTVKHTEASVWADFKAKANMHLPLGRKTIQQKC
jgi:alpha-amylase